MSKPKILVLPGSTRAGSVNVKLAGVVVKALLELGADVTWISLADYEMPIYDGDLENEKGVPQNAIKLGRLFEQSHGVVLVSPEYNGSIAPVLKNALDWMSRDLGDVDPYSKAVFALAGCSPSALGTARGINHLRDVMVSLKADLITPQLTIGQAGSAFDDNEQLVKDVHNTHLNIMCNTLIERASILARD